MDWKQVRLQAGSRIETVELAPPPSSVYYYWCSISSILPAFHHDTDPSETQGGQ